LGRRIVAALLDLGGRFILTVSLLRFGFGGSSPPGASPIAVSMGGHGGGLEPAGCVFGFWSSSCILVSRLRFILSSNQHKDATPATHSLNPDHPLDRKLICAGYQQMSPAQNKIWALNRLPENAF